MDIYVMFAIFWNQNIVISFSFAFDKIFLDKSCWFSSYI